MPETRKERCVALNVGRLMSELERMTVTELRRRYAEVFGEETRSYHKEYLVRRIAWRVQANAEGDLAERARRLPTHEASTTKRGSWCSRGRSRGET